MGVDVDKYKRVKQALDIPQDEPIFIIRGQDILAVAAIARYRNLAAVIEKERPIEDWFASLDQQIEEFKKWQEDHPRLVKIPD